MRELRQLWFSTDGFCVPLNIMSGYTSVIFSVKSWFIWSNCPLFCISAADFYLKQTKLKNFLLNFKILQFEYLVSRLHEEPSEENGGSKKLGLSMIFIMYVGLFFQYDHSLWISIDKAFNMCHSAEIDGSSCKGTPWCPAYRRNHHFHHKTYRRAIDLGKFISKHQFELGMSLLNV